MNLSSEHFPARPAWTEIDLGKLRRNLRLIRQDLPREVNLLAVVKDEAYGHGALDVARIALEEGAWGFGLSTLEEAMHLRDGGITAPEHREFCFHNWLSLFRDTSPVSTAVVNARCGKVSASSSQFWRIVLPSAP